MDTTTSTTVVTVEEDKKKRERKERNNERKGEGKKLNCSRKGVNLFFLPWFAVKGAKRKTFANVEVQVDTL